MPRTAGPETYEGRKLYAELQRRQVAVKRAVEQRDRLARKALDRGLGVRGVASALGIDKGTVSRRYNRREHEGEL